MKIAQVSSLPSKVRPSTLHQIRLRLSQYFGGEYYPDVYLKLVVLRKGNNQGVKIKKNVKMPTIRRMFFTEIMLIGPGVFFDTEVRPGCAPFRGAFLQIMNTAPNYLNYNSNIYS
jgi:hypothetical protein